MRRVNLFCIKMTHFMKRTDIRFGYIVITLCIGKHQNRTIFLLFRRFHGTVCHLDLIRFPDVILIAKHKIRECLSLHCFQKISGIPLILFILPQCDLRIFLCIFFCNRYRAIRGTIITDMDLIIFKCI